MGLIFKIPAGLLWFIGGIWGLFICWGIITDEFGTIVAVIGVFLLPIFITLAPIYEGIANGDWFPAMLVYGSSVGGIILFMIGAAIDGD